MGRRAVRAAGVIVGLFVMSSVGFIAVPPHVEAPSGDAVVVHAGGRGERLETALALMDAGVAPTLVIMYGTASRWDRANRLCGQTEPYAVVCPSPEPPTTIGEARGLVELGRDRSWSSIVVVTSDYHLRRARFLDQKCLPDVEVEGVAAQSDLPLPIMLSRVAREVVAMAQAALASCV